MIEYELIKEFYDGSFAKRSGLPYINHIDEGLVILDHLKVEETTKAAFCLHPILQETFYFDFDFKESRIKSIILATEYRNIANSYLSNGTIDRFIGISCDEIRQMLIADKVQNYKDFIRYIFEEDKHSRYNLKLLSYFIDWFEVLGINEEVEELIKLID